MHNFANSVFRAFVKELGRRVQKPCYNSPKVIQSSVGMIFRLHSDYLFTSASDINKGEFNKIELLFTQRAGYEGDRNAYNIVFPGGQCDDGQSDLAACKRQLFEEVGIQVDQQCLYLGQLPSNFYYMQKRGKKLYITCHVWCLRQQHMKWQAKLNAAELRDSKWVNLEQMLSNDSYQVENSLRMGILQRMASKYKMKIIADVSKNVLSISTPQLNLGMDRNLWGLTLWIWSYALQMSCANLTKGEIQPSQLKLMKTWIDNMQTLHVQFKEGFWLAYPSLAIIKGWQYFYRTRPFTYHRNPKALKYTILVLLLCVLMFFFL